MCYRDDQYEIIKPDNGEELKFEANERWIHKCCNCGEEHYVTLDVDPYDGPIYVRFERKEREINECDQGQF